MKRIVVLLLAVLLEVFLCSCTSKGENMVKNNDQQIVNSHFDRILTSIQNHDKEALVSAFTQDYHAESNLSDETIKRLFEYFDGEVDEYNDWGGPYVETTKENGQVVQIAEATYDVKTTVCEYRFAIRFFLQNTVNPKHIGIESLYIIKAAEDIDISYAYWGDGAYTPGINIGIPNSVSYS